MNKLDLDYQNLLKDILENGVKKETRNGGTISVFGRQIRHDMKDGFPLLTTKKMAWKTMVVELLWFLRGDTNIKYLVDNGCHIWDGDCYQAYLRECEKLKKDLHESGRPLTKEEFIQKIKDDNNFSNKWGDLGRIYGAQWRNWKTITKKWWDDPEYQGYGADTRSGWEYEETQIDQISELIKQIKENPDSRRLLVNAWAVHDLPYQVLPPCHYGFQVYTRELSFDEFWDRLTPKQRGTMEKPYEGETYNGIDSRIEFKNITSEIHNLPTRAISLMWNQRSVDTFLGLPFNIASYGLLLEIIAKEVNMVPEELIGNLGDVHLYSNHLDAAKEQIGRELTHDEKIEYARSLYGEEVWWDINNKRVITVLQKKKQTREPFPLPTLKVESEVKWTEGDCLPTYSISHFTIENYQSHQTIKAPLSN